MRIFKRRRLVKRGLTTAVKRVSRATEASGNSGAVRVWEALRVEGQFRLTNPLLLERLEERGREITGEITDTMLEDLRTVLANEYYKGGNGPRTIAKSLDTIFPATYANRAQTIARTETVAMQGQMLQETYKRNGVEKRQWFAFLDGSTRDEHAEAHGQVRAIDEPFDVGGESLMHPGDGSAENAINCRCDVLPVIGNATDLPEQPWMGE